MKKFLVFLCSSILIFGLVGTASAYSYIDDDSNPGSERDLYQIFEDLYGIDYGSSDALFDDRGTAAGVWYETDGHVDITVRYAGYDQELGFEDSDGYHTVLSGIPSGTQETDAEVDTNGNFIWVEKLSGSESEVGPWYSEVSRNVDGKVHFYAFDVADLFEDTNNVWLIAFEDLEGLGDADYNDLVAEVKEVAPIPEPSTMLLFISGLIGLAGFRKNFRKI